MFKGGGEQFPSGSDDNENSNPNPNQGQKLSLFEENKRLAEQIAADRARRSDASSPDQSSSKADAKVSPETAKQLDQKMKQNRGLKAFLKSKKAAAIAFVAALGVTIGAVAFSNNRNKQPSELTISTEAFTEDHTVNSPNKADTSDTSDYDDEFAARGFIRNDEAATETQETQEVSNPYAGEREDGFHWDLAEYADRENKESYNAYGYDCSNLYGDEAGLKAEFIKSANKNPEILAPYAKLCLQDAEKSAIGIGPGSSYEQIDEKLKGTGGGALQREMIAHLAEDINSPYTKIDFNRRTGTDYTLYIYSDAANDADMTPFTNHIGYDIKERYEAPQATVYLPEIDYIDENAQKHYKTYIDENGNEQVKLFEAMTVNLKCGAGGQPSFQSQESIAGVLKISADEDDEHDDKSKKHSESESESESKDTTGNTNNSGNNTNTTNTGDHKSTPNTPTPETSTPETSTPETPTPETPTPETPTPETNAPKDVENLTRIDENALQDIANYIGSETVNVTPTTSVEDGEHPETAEPVITGETGATVVSREETVPAETAPASEPASVVQEVPDNNYSENIAPEPAQPVAPAPEAQAAADAAADAAAAEPAPTTAGEAAGTLADLGIG